MANGETANAQVAGWQGVTDWYMSAISIGCVIYCANIAGLTFLLHHFGAPARLSAGFAQANRILSIINIFATFMVMKLHMFYMVPRSCCFSAAVFLVALLLCAPPILFTFIRQDWETMFDKPMSLIVYGCNGTDILGGGGKY